jgi:hypothetical protein
MAPPSQQPGRVLDAARAADPSPLGATRSVRYTLVITCRPAVRSNSISATAPEPSEMA